MLESTRYVRCGDETAAGQMLSSSASPAMKTCHLTDAKAELYRPCNAMGIDIGGGAASSLFVSLTFPWQYLPVISHWDNLTKSK